ncbi:hypothetical protein PG988_015417 [Apiospora saccharicola]
MVLRMGDDRILTGGPQRLGQDPTINDMERTDEGLTMKKNVATTSVSTATVSDTITLAMTSPTRRGVELTVGASYPETRPFAA